MSELQALERSSAGTGFLRGDEDELGEGHRSSPWPTPRCTPCTERSYSQISPLGFIIDRSIARYACVVAVVEFGT